MSMMIKSKKIAIDKDLSDALDALYCNSSIINKEETVRKFLSDAGAKPKDAAILSLIFAHSGINTFLHREQLSEIEVNQILINICENCCLTLVSAQYYLNAILSSFGFKVEIDKKFLENIAVKHSGAGISYDLTGCIYADFLAKAEKAVNYREDSFFAEDNNSVVFKKLISEKSPMAMFLQGRCYFEGVGTEKDAMLALRYIKDAASAGLANANAYLGDIYYQNGHLSKSFEHYTAMGSVALSKDRKNNIAVLLGSKKTNNKMFLAGLFLSVLNIVYFVCMGLHIFDFASAGGIRAVVLSVIGVLVTTAVTVLMCMFHRFSKYDSVGFFVIANTVATALVTIIYVLI